MTAPTDVPIAVRDEWEPKPTLFLMFSPDLAKNMCNTCCLYADYLKVAGINFEKHIKIVRA